MKTYFFPSPPQSQTSLLASTTTLEAYRHNPRILVGTIAGIPVHVDPGVPPNEIWAEGPDGIRHIFRFGDHQ